jgi:hypothetical protein
LCRTDHAGFIAPSFPDRAGVSRRRKLIAIRRPFLDSHRSEFIIPTALRILEIKVSQTTILIS